MTELNVEIPEEDLWKQPIEVRIPENWGKWVSCGPGWKTLILELNQKLSEIDSNYMICQVKEKFGGLRYYAELTLVDPETKETLAYDSLEGEKFRKLISEAEARSYKICEECGKEDSTVSTGARGKYWIRTLCENCAAKKV